ncbi:hypothetical protein CRG98_022369 [Punica granatum]|uniref:Uncharacterized protein n=1 Tax=Punica granatum TaxID=22663 RepID=A0A2I0JLW0_PUNGR|nr:hypothetical protein CRG98_022369 [Punica granatum]
MAMACFRCGGASARRMNGLVCATLAYSKDPRLLLPARRQSQSQRQRQPHSNDGPIAGATAHSGVGLGLAQLYVNKFPEPIIS